MTVVEIDLPVGGRWRYVMVGGNGQEVAFHGEYRELVPDERIVTTEVFEMPGATDDDAALNIVTFTEADGRTTLSLLAQAVSKEQRDAIMASGMEAGMQEQLDLLEELAGTIR